LPVRFSQSLLNERADDSQRSQIQQSVDSDHNYLHCDNAFDRDDLHLRQEAAAWQQKVQEALRGVPRRHQVQRQGLFLLSPHHRPDVLHSPLITLLDAGLLAQLLLGIGRTPNFHHGVYDHLPALAQTYSVKESSLL